MILGPASAPLEVVIGNLPAEATTLFRDLMFPALWAVAEDHNVDPVGVVAQSGKETAWGSFPGRVEPWFYNTAGIKVRDVVEVMRLVPTNDGDHPLVHAQFASWDVGALAHVQHLRAYCDQPVSGLIVDPRYLWVIGRHDCRTWADLGGRWAPSPTYGTEIEAIIRRLRGTE